MVVFRVRELRDDFIIRFSSQLQNRGLLLEKEAEKELDVTMTLVKFASQRSELRLYNPVII
jgi:hypothetical protein